MQNFLESYQVGGGQTTPHESVKMKQKRVEEIVKNLEKLRHGPAVIGFLSRGIMVEGVTITAKEIYELAKMARARKKERK